MPADDYETRKALVEYVAARISAVMQGEGDEFDEIHEDMPRNLFPSGALYPPDDGDVVAELEEEFGRTEFMPSAMGFVIATRRADDLELTFETRLSLYYPVFPTHDEVLRFLKRFGDGNDVKLPPVYKRIPIDVPPTTLVLRLEPTDGFVESVEATAALQGALDRARVKALADTRLFATRPRERQIGRSRLYRRSDLENEAWWNQTVTASTRRASPMWTGKVLYRIRPSHVGFFVEILIANTTSPGNWVLEEVFIGTVLSAAIAREDLVRIPLPAVEAKDYRYEPWTSASGRNCDVSVVTRDDSVRVTTESVPIFQQKALESRAWKGPDGKLIDLSFESFAVEGPSTAMPALLWAMDRYLASWNAIAAAAPGANPTGVDEGRRAFEEELLRFKRGVEVLLDPANADILDAFRLMNDSFARRFRHYSRDGNAIEKIGPAGWRTFQLVFIVSSLVGMLSRDELRASENSPVPTVLWFPTGAGKTEAYLGLIVLHAFWDRIRGKPYGVTAFAKFPLRMLSLQQFARVVAVMEHADDVRRTTPVLEGKRGEPFSVGYYAGERNTLNLLDFPVSPDRADKPSGWTRSFIEIMNDKNRLEYELDRHMKVKYCPVCRDEEGRRGEIVTTFDRLKPGFRHECRRCGRALQLHLTDTEVLRFLPTLVIATIDKLARLATEPWGRTIFGEAKVRCATHGFLIDWPRKDDGTPDSRCPVLSCGATLTDSPANVDPVPGILVQDELHLLTESLGAFASHYETMIMETARRQQERGVGRGPWMIIGSTATIEGYERLVRQLYNSGHARRFPAPGPSRSESFHVEERMELQRLIVGVRSHGMSHVDTVMKILLEYHRVLAPIAEPNRCSPNVPLPQPVRGVSDEERRKLARRYRTAVTYGINRNEVAQVNNSYLGQLNPYMYRDGLAPFESNRVLNLTGDSPAEQIQRFLDSMERGDDERFVQAVTATSVISHGIDLNDLNCMVFRGMPHRISEYIQAMSRVGRVLGVPGLVVNVYNPNRERDSSHFEAHSKYLELRDVLLRNIPTTRFSYQALEKTLPGLVLHFVNYEQPFLNLWRKTTVEGLRGLMAQQLDGFKQAVRRRLGLDTAPDPESSLVRRQDERVAPSLQRIRIQLERRPMTPNESIYAADRLDALRSLRETDEAIPVYSEVAFEHGGG